MPTNCKLLKYKVLSSKNVLHTRCKEAKIILKRVVIDYIFDRSCPNDFILYREKYEDTEICQECGHDRYRKLNNKGKENGPPPNILR